MQVIFALIHLGPFIGNEGRELTRTIVGIGSGDLPSPRRLARAHRIKTRDCAVLLTGLAQHIEALSRVFGDFLTDGSLGNFARRIIQLVEQAHIFRMVRHGHKVQRPATPNGLTIDLDRLAAPEAIGFIWRRFGGHQAPSIEGIASVQVHLAEIDLSLARRDLGRRRWGLGTNRLRSLRTVRLGGAAADNERRDEGRPTMRHHNSPKVSH